MHDGWQGEEGIGLVIGFGSLVFVVGVGGQIRRTKMVAKVLLSRDVWGKVSGKIFVVVS